jgi:dTDP-4-dehydrorhamnose reductase
LEDGNIPRQLMKLLITGHKGRIGSAIYAHLKEAGHEVYGYDLVDGDDVLDPEKLSAACAGKDVVVHLAAIPHPSPKLGFADYFKLNVVGTFNLCEACAERGVRRLVFMSSQARYGLYGGRGYGCSKRICEEMIAWYSGHKRSKPLAGLFRDCGAYFTAMVLRLTGYECTVSPSTMLRAIDTALAADVQYGVLDVTDSEKHYPYTGEPTVLEQDIFVDQVC